MHYELVDGPFPKLSIDSIKLLCCYFLCVSLNVHKILARLALLALVVSDSCKTCHSNCSVELPGR